MNQQNQKFQLKIATCMFWVCSKTNYSSVFLNGLKNDSNLLHLKKIKYYTKFFTQIRFLIGAIKNGLG